MIASGSNDGTVKVWDANTGKPLCTLKGHRNWVSSVSFSPDGYIIASGSNDKTVKVWDANTGKPLRTLEGHSGWVNSVSFSLYGRLIASGSVDSTVKVWDANTGKPLRTLKGHSGWVNSVSFSPDGYIIASGSNDKTVKVWDANTGKPLRTLKGHRNWVSSVYFSPDGRMIASGSNDKTIKVWDANTGKPLHTLEGHSFRVSSVYFSLDGRMIASGSWDKTIKVWDANTGKPLRTLEGHSDQVNSVSFSPDGCMIASGSNDKTVKVWDANTGKPLRTLEGHSDRVNSVSFSPDGRMITSGSNDKTVKVWDANTGKPLRTLEGHSGWVSSVSFSPDGRMIASGSFDKTVKVWDAETGAELQSLTVIPVTHALIAIMFMIQPFVELSLGITIFGKPDVIIRDAEVGASIRGLSTMSVTSHGKVTVPVSYTSAKVVLIGESNVGKSCLALRMATGNYEEQGTTHGMRTWKILPEQLNPEVVTPAGEVREIFLWDLGGQEEYRLVLQLFLPETTLAMIMFDPTRGKVAYDDVREWVLRLGVQTKNQGGGTRTVKLLVGTKLDTGNEVVDTAEIDRLKNECCMIDYYPTSAKMERGLAVLGKAITGHIKWEELSKTTRPRLFQIIREFISRRQNNGDVVLLYSELENNIHEQTGDEFDPQAVNTVVGQLAEQGSIVETRLATGERVLILQIGFITIYAGSLILAAKSNPRGVPALEESQVISGKLPLPRIKPEDRLDPLRERIVLECVVQLLLDRGICFKHGGLLIFPTEFRQASENSDKHSAQIVPLYYDFSGPIDNIYASLVTQLAVSEKFGRVRLWQDHTEYDSPATGVCGLRKIDRTSGFTHLDLLFSENVKAETRNLFTVFVEEHLRKEGVAITEVLEMVCVCGHCFEESVIEDRIRNEHADVGCPRCDRRLKISEGAQKARTSVASELFALKKQIEKRKRAEIDEVKREFKSTEIFLSYSHKDDNMREELSKHLSVLRRQNVIGIWHDRIIGPGTDWKENIDKHIESAGIILLLVSPDFFESDYCYDIEMKRALERHSTGNAKVIPVILRPVDWTTSPIGKLQALPRDNKPITVWQNRDEALAEVAKGIRSIVEEILRPGYVAGTLGSGILTEKSASVQIQQQPVRILHLSDLHFSESDDPTVRLQPLISDLTDEKEGFGYDHLDYLVVSGDLTNQGTRQEYEKVHIFLAEMVKKFKLSAQRCIIVPGNHDLNWDVEVYKYKAKRAVDVSKMLNGSYVQQGDGFLLRDDTVYQRRFENFTRFYHQFTQEEYPLSPDRQGFSLLFKETGIQFLAMNSSWEIDEYYPSRSSIHEACLANALIKAESQINKAKMDEDAGVLRIAVWHHPVTGNDKIVGDDFLERLRTADFKLCLHGHVHEERADVIGYYHPARKIHIAGAGSFGVVAAHRPPSTPRLYNVIEIPGDHSMIKVHTRCMRRDVGAWEPWAIWPGDNKDTKKSYYEIKI